MDSLIEGYCSRCYSNYLPSDIIHLIELYYHHNTCFVDGGDLCNINIIGNILICKYTISQLIYDRMKFYADSVLTCIICSVLTTSAFIIIHIVYVIVSYVVFSIILCGISGDDNCITSKVYANSEYLLAFINHYVIRYLLLTLSIWCSLPEILRCIDRSFFTRKIPKRQNVCYVSTIMDEKDNSYQSMVKVLKCTGGVAFTINLEFEPLIGYYELSPLNFRYHHTLCGWFDRISSTGINSLAEVWPKLIKDDGILEINYYLNTSTLKIIMDNDIVFECDEVNQCKDGEYKLYLKMEFIEPGCVEFQLV